MPQSGVCGRRTARAISSAPAIGGQAAVVPYTEHSPLTGNRKHGQQQHEPQPAQQAVR
ncbi:hypothetical protein BC739_003270 [Kutzneria viridogrisea]|uniref:Uncharacterized protein n=1 Tax=Kutzneria viridogrisea TaxID=47990 RepID=A0ABR6BGR2_9PSEU|nr:hypothetical protein [Kutzneria viridogrisea]